jgi:hypothetical protein
MEQPTTRRAWKLVAMTALCIAFAACLLPAIVAGCSLVTGFDGFTIRDGDLSADGDGDADADADADADGDGDSGPRTCETDEQCEDGRSCTRDHCDRSVGTCSHEPDDGACPPLVDRPCQQWRCQPDALLIDPATGCTLVDRDGASCEDAFPCRTGEVCVGARCDPDSGTPTCDDRIPCTDDGCLRGICLEVEPRHERCTEPARTWCDPNAGCVEPPQCDVSRGCDDGRACNGMELCIEGRCVSGEPRRCDDGIACTEDRCVEPDGSCAFEPVDSMCEEDANPCTRSGCDLERGCGAPAEPGASCEGTFACRIGETCDGAGSCDPASGSDERCLADTDPCTTASCLEPIGCVVEAIGCGPEDGCCPAGGCGWVADPDCAACDPYWPDGDCPDWCTQANDLDCCTAGPCLGERDGCCPSRPCGYDDPDCTECQARPCQPEPDLCCPETCKETASTDHDCCQMQPCHLSDACCPAHCAGSDPDC